MHTLNNFTQFISLNVTHNTLNNTDITLQLNYKALDLDGFCTTQDTLDYEHSCVDLAEYCEYCKKICEVE